MVLIKVSNDGEVHYFSTKAKAAQWLETYQQNINYYINFNKKCNGWTVEVSEDPDVRNAQIDDFNG